MCLVDDGTGTGNKVAKYYIDTDGNYNELYTYVLYSPDGGVLETNTFTLKVTLAAPPNPAADARRRRDAQQRQPAGSGRADQQAVEPGLRGVRRVVAGPAARLHSDPGGGARPVPGGADLRRAGLQRLQPERGRRGQAAGADFADLLGNLAYPIAGSTTIQPLDPKTGKVVPFYGSLSHGLDKQVTVALLQSADKSSYLPRTTSPQTITAGLYGGNGRAR